MVGNVQDSTTNTAKPEAHGLALLLAQELDSAAADGRVAAIERLRRWCDNNLPVAKARDDQFLLFVLSVFLQDVFFNLVGDVPYSPQGEKCRQEFFQTLVRELNLLAAVVRGGDVGVRAQALQGVVSVYLATIAKLNELDTPGGVTDDTEE